MQANTEITAKLLKPLLTYNLGGAILDGGVVTKTDNAGAGFVFRQGSEQLIDEEIAVVLTRDARFRLKGGGFDTGQDRTAEQEAIEAKRPVGDELLDAIRRAASDFDEDADWQFDRNGKPSHFALSKALGYPITTQERDRALSAAPKFGERDIRPARPAVSRVENADGKVERIVTTRKAQVNRAPPADIVDPDETTSGAIPT